MDSVQLAAVLAAVVLIASVISVELGVTVALLELTLGVAAGNLLHLQTQDWLDFIAKFGSIVLTFLAGMEVDPAYMRRRLGASFGIGVVSFLGPFVVASATAYLVLDWSTRASLIAGTALSTTSLAVVYAVLVERGLTDTGIGKLLMSATFVTDLCTALALSAIFIKPNVWFPVFLAVSLVLILLLPRLAPWFFGRYGDRVIEPEIKLVFLSLLILMVLADESNGHAVLPAFVLGLVRRHERLCRSGRDEPGTARRPTRREDAPEDCPHLPVGAPRRSASRHVHDLADEHGADLRDDLVSLRAERRDHRQDPVLLAGQRRRPLGSRSHSNRRALVPSGRGA